MTIDDIINDQKAIAEIAFVGFTKFCELCKIPDPEKEWGLLAKKEGDDTYSCIKAMLNEVKNRINA